MLPTPTPEIISAIPSVSLIPVWLEELGKWAAIAAGLIGFYRLVVKPIHDIKSSVKAVDDKVVVVQDDVADMQCDRLNQAYDYYVHKGFCPKDAKDRLSDMCDKYCKRGRNHIAPHYREILLNLPDNPPETRRTPRTATAAKRT